MERKEIENGHSGDASMNIII